MSFKMAAKGIATGTGATLNVELGFTPDYVILINVSDGEKIEWYRDMEDLGTELFGFKEVAAGTKSLLTTAATGVATYAGAEGPSGSSKGFTIGATAGVNVNTEELLWFAGFVDG